MCLKTLSKPLFWFKSVFRTVVASESREENGSSKSEKRSNDLEEKAIEGDGAEALNTHRFQAAVGSFNATAELA
jgi:hypothetical protein